ncbi:OmpW/AlkL family protein [Actibacterium ureilyticum]|uniref:OmpW/AlkL family protein n=1 Tax=Actibacterium ureilyticum TaxID=1590614 RepID=UPI000BAAE700|nr:OmpW family outer membrane protein [Actibacterium ureilyticum]
MKLRTVCTTAFILACTTAPVLAQSAGDWTLGVGVGYVAPKDGNGTVAGADANVGDNLQPTFTFEYFVRDNLGIELLAATPFKHNISLDGLGKVATTQHLPPTLSLQYHFANNSAWTPFLGAGVNYTKFFNTDSKGAITGSDVDLDDSWGVALHAGVDYKISDNGSLRMDLRWIDIDTDVELNGVDVGTAKIDPVVFGMSYVHRF